MAERLEETEGQDQEQQEGLQEERARTLQPVEAHQPSAREGHAPPDAPAFGERGPRAFGFPLAGGGGTAARIPAIGGVGSLAKAAPKMPTMGPPKLEGSLMVLA